MKVAGAKLPILAALVDKSLLQRDPDGRYEIHELLRQYAEAKLKEQAQEIDDLLDKHSDYYCALLAHLTPLFMTSKEQEVVPTILPDIENVRAAWRWAVDHVKPDNLEKS